MDKEKQGDQEPTKPEGEKTPEKNPDGEKTSNKSEESIHPNRYYHVKDKLDKAEEKLKEYEEKYGSDDSEDEKNKNNDTPPQDDVVERKVQEILERRELKSMNLPDEIEEKAKKFAKLEGMSVKEAAESDYIQHLQKEYKRKQRIASATPSREGSKNSGGVKSHYDPSKPRNPEEYDMDSEEGRKRWQQDGKAREAWMSNH